MTQESFEVGAEFLHLFIGRDVILRMGDSGIPFRVGAVRYEPERDRVLAQIDTPMVRPIEIELTPDQVVEVAHRVVSS